MTEQILTSRRPTRQWSGSQSDTLADVLERVLDKGVVIVGDVVVSVLDVELLTLRLRLFIASADTAREMGLDWWMNDPFFSSKATRTADRDQRDLADENRELRDRVDALERALGTRPAEPAALPKSDVDTSTADLLTGTRATEEPVARSTARSSPGGSSTGRSGGGRRGAGGS